MSLIPITVKKGKKKKQTRFAYLLLFLAPPAGLEPAILLFTDPVNDASCKIEIFCNFFLDLIDCDLLILDDLGTELAGGFVTAALYNLLNERMMAGKSTIISTNLLADELARRYSPQIASRIQGGFKGLTFVGEDIRILKSRGM